ncbi:MAG: hypothetical protein R3279_03840 [Putridiphycobacter sp.]|nr:hypothetical protein [Putridiphycobacter sp.]
MKNILLLSTTLFFVTTLKAQDEYCNCCKDSLSSEDPIIQKIQTFNPTVFFLKDTVFSVNDFNLKRKLPTKKSCGIWVVIEDSDGGETNLNCGPDYKYDCESHMFELLNCNLIRKGSILQIFWIYP